VPVVAELTSADCQTAETVAGGPAETAGIAVAAGCLGMVGSSVVEQVAG